MSRIVCLTLLLSPCVCLAGPITIQNPSFEAQPLNDGAWIDGTLTGWNVSGFLAGPMNQTDTQFIGATDDATPSPIPDGLNVAFVRSPFKAIFQYTNVTVEPLTQYSLDVAVGHRLDGLFAEFDAAILVGTTIAATGTLEPAQGEWERLFVTFTTGTDVSGYPGFLGIGFQTRDQVDPNGQPGIYQVQLDDVHLTATAVPEASSFLLLGCAAATMIAWRRLRTA